MHIFLSYESTAPAVFYLTKLGPLVQEKLRALEEIHYGDELTDIAIISIVLPEEILKNGFHPERRLFQRKSCSADIRLQIDFSTFLKANPAKRYELYADHILTSIAVLEHKVSPEFQYDMLLRDVSALLQSEDLKSQCAQIKRFF